jgi:hypothetical protein
MSIPKNDAHFVSLRDALDMSRNSREPSKIWLYLPKDTPWTLETECFFEDIPDDDDDEEYLVSGRVFQPTLDIDTVSNCVKWADRLAGKRNNEARLEIFSYYFRFDAVPEKLGTPEPPNLSPEESMRELDLQWYDKLGPEDLKRHCKREGCQRGSIRFSALCRVHHFESLLKRPCPFTH